MTPRSRCSMPQWAALGTTGRVGAEVCWRWRWPARASGAQRSSPPRQTVPLRPSSWRPTPANSLATASLAALSVLTSLHRGQPSKADACPQPERGRARSAALPREDLIGESGAERKQTAADSSVASSVLNFLRMSPFAATLERLPPGNWLPPIGLPPPTRSADCTSRPRGRGDHRTSGSLPLCPPLVGMREQVVRACTIAMMGPS